MKARKIPPGSQGEGPFDVKERGMGRRETGSKPAEEGAGFPAPHGSLVPILSDGTISPASIPRLESPLAGTLSALRAPGS